MLIRTPTYEIITCPVGIGDNSERPGVVVMAKHIKDKRFWIVSDAKRPPALIHRLFPQIFERRIQEAMELAEWTMKFLELEFQKEDLKCSGLDLKDPTDPAKAPKHAC